MDNVKKFYIYLENTDDTKVPQIIPWNGQSSCINSLSYYFIIIYEYARILLSILHEYAI